MASENSSSFSTTTLATTLAHSSATPHVFSTPIHFKLDEENFLTWEQQVQATIIGLKLSEFLDGFTAHPHYLTQEDQVSNIINPRFLQ